MRILLIPNTTCSKDFLKIYFELKKNHGVKILIWHNQLNKIFKKINAKNKIIYKNNLYWNMDNYHKKINSMNFFEKLFLVRNEIKWAKQLFNLNNFKTVVTFGDRETSLNLSILKISKIYRSKVFININFRSGDNNDMINRRVKKRNYQLLNKYNPIRLLLKNQFKSYTKYSYVSFYNLLDNFIYLALNILPKNPWVIGGGNSDYVFVENKYVKNDYIKLGCKKNKLLLAHSLDSENINNSLIKKKNKSNKLMLLISQLSEHGDRSINDNLIKVDKLCSFIKKINNKFNLKIIISLHPKQKFGTYKWIEKKYKFEILKEKFSKNIIDCRYIVSEIPSSIIDWAIIFNIKYIVADVNNFTFKIRKNFKKFHFTNFLKIEKYIIKEENKKNKFLTINRNYFKFHKNKVDLIEKLSSK